MEGRVVIFRAPETMADALKRDRRRYENDIAPDEIFPAPRFRSEEERAEGAQATNEATSKATEVTP